MCGDSYPLSIKWQSCYLPNVWVKNSNFHRTLLPLWSVHVCAVLSGLHWPLWRLAWDNQKLLTQASLLTGARRLYHCDVIVSLAPRAEHSWHSKPNVIHGNSLGPNTRRVLHMDWKPNRSVNVPYLMPLVRLQLFKYGGSGNAQYISSDKMAAHVQWELCGTNFFENIANLRVSCYDRNNDRSAQVLFVQHPMGQVEWLRQNHSGLDCIIRPAPLGAGRTTPSQPGHYSLNNYT